MSTIDRDVQVTLLALSPAPAGLFLCLLTQRIASHEDRTPTHGYEPTREAAMAAFAKSWRRE